MRKQFLLIFTCFIVFAGISLPSINVDANQEVTTSTLGFKDVPTNQRFYDEIHYLVDKGIISGFPDGTFRPNATVTRAQAAIMIGRALGLDGKSMNTTFKDVPAEVTGSGYIASAVKKGIISGFPDGTYRPFAAVTRGQMAIFLDRSFELKKGITNEFKDVSPKMVAYQSILNVAEDKIASGYPDGTYRPDQSIKRGELSAFLSRTLNKKSEEVPIEEPVEEPMTLLDLNQPYVSPDNGMTVTMQNITAVDKGDFYEYTITYEESNNTTDSAIDQGSFKIYYKNGDSEPQYGFFNKLYPGEKDTRSYTFKSLKTQEPYLIEYGADLFFKKEPTKETLKWGVKIPYEELTEEPIEDPIEEPFEEPVGEPMTLLDLNQPYVSPDNGMTVTMQSITAVDKGDFYEYTITYEELNNTTDSVIDQGSFKIYYKNGDPEPQYGFFNKLYPGEKDTRSYTFKSLKTQEPYLIEYGADLFFKKEPTKETLKWGVEIPL